MTRRLGFLLLFLLLAAPVEAQRLSPSGGSTTAAGVEVLSAQTGGAGCTGSGTDDTLFTYTLPADTLSANGKGVRITAWVTQAANTNTKIVKLHFGGTVVAQLSANAAANVVVTQDAIVIRTGATAQVAKGLSLSAVSLPTNDLRRTAPGETLSGTVVIKLTGNCATAANDIVGDGFLVEKLN